MEAAQTIRDAVAQVHALRARSQGEPALAAAALAVKRLQARRFSGSYADLLAAPRFEPAARFFLQELYGDKDYSERDAQFARIAGALEKLFPAQVVGTAVALARLHALTEELDDAMARAWAAGAPQDAPGLRYACAWRQVGRAADRATQLREVLQMGRELARLTRTAGLRTMLRMMRGPAAAAGLGALQQFLETGFDTFAGMARTEGAVDTFLGTIEARESALMELLFAGDLVTCGTELERTLGQAR